MTGYELSPWWRLDLLDYYRISTVVITARSDGAPQQTNGAEIRIGNSTVNNGTNNPRCAVTSGFQLGQTISYSCGVMVGRYITLVMTGHRYTLSLCEVEVYDTENIARKGTVIQPSTFYPRVAENAIDGIRYGSVEAYCSTTGLEATPWWRLDLLDYYTSTIIITARSDAYFGETNGAEIRIGDSLENNGNNNPRCAVVSGLTASASTFSYSCDGMEGRYVNVILPGTGYLTLCEMEVYGKRVLRKSILRLKFLSRVDAAALSDKILSQEQLRADSVCAEVMKYCIKGWPDRSRLDALVDPTGLKELFSALTMGCYCGVLDWYVEVAQLGPMRSADVVNHLKSIFARHGIPEILVTDNGPQFTGAHMTAIASEYEFEHVTSSPRYPQSNSEAVQTIKNLLKKATDPYRALLAYTNTPLGNGFSPAQLLMGRCLRTTLPVHPVVLELAIPDLEKR
nr:uncharacterized protein LOC129439701 [Misgurnus anguillicaudatus]